MNRNTDFIPFALPLLGRDEEEAVLRVLRSGWLTTGREALAFEEEFAARLGTRFAVAVNSATAGLHLAMEALEIPENSQVITTPYTFTATAEVIRYRRAHPLFVDIQEDTFNIDPELVEKALKTPGVKKKASALLPVHLGGRPCAMEELIRITEKANLPVVEDAAHAFPSHIAGKPLGTWGRIGVFSFYATKTITTGEGGMVATDHEEIAEKIRCLRLHGIDREVWGRFQSRKLAAWEYDVVAPGYKYNLTDIAAAIGRIQLKKAHEFLLRRTRMAETYREAFQDIPGILLPGSAEGHAWHLFIIRLDQEKLTLTRDRFMEKMAEEGVGTSVHYKPLHLMSYYRDTYGLKPEDFPAALKVFQNCVSLPLYPGLEDKQLERIIHAVKKITTEALRKDRIFKGYENG